MRRVAGGDRRPPHHRGRRPRQPHGGDGRELQGALRRAHDDAERDRVLAALGGSLDLDEVLTRVLESAVSATAADAALVTIETEPGPPVAATLGLSAEEAERQTAAQPRDVSDVRSVAIGYRYTDEQLASGRRPDPRRRRRPARGRRAHARAADGLRPRRRNAVPGGGGARARGDRAPRGARARQREPVPRGAPARRPRRARRACTTAATSTRRSAARSRARSATTGGSR